MKIVLLMLGLAVNLFLWGAMPLQGVTDLTPEEGMQVLDQALAATSKTSWVNEIPNPMAWRPEVTSVRCARLVASDGVVFKRTDIVCKDGGTESYIVNREGLFGERQGTASKLEFAPEAWLQDGLFQDYYLDEKKNWAYQKEETTINGIPCVILTVKTENWDARVDVLVKKCLRMEDDLEKRRQVIAGCYPYTRVFVIDQTNHRILNRKHYDHNGKLLVQYQQGTPVAGITNDESLYVAPENSNNNSIKSSRILQITAISDQQDAQKAQLQAATKGKRAESWKRKTVKFLMSPTFAISAGGLAFGCLIIGLVIRKIRQRA